MCQFNAQQIISEGVTIYIMELRIHYGLVPFVHETCGTREGEVALVNQSIGATFQVFWINGRDTWRRTANDLRTVVTPITYNI